MCSVEKGVIVNMNMTVSVNNQSGIPYTQYGTDKQKARAAKFVKADNNEITNLAYRMNNIKGEKRRDEKFAKRMAGVVLALPAIVGTAAAIRTKGAVSVRSLQGLKSAVKIGGAMALIGGVFKANDVIASKRSKVAKSENKHPILTLTGLSAIAAGVVTGAEAVAKTISPKATEKLTKLAKKIKLNKFAEKLDKAPEAVRTMASQVAEKISLPQGVKNKLSTISSKVKMPQILKDGYKNVVNADMTQKAVKGMKALGKTALKNPIAATIITIGALSLAHAAKRGIETSHTASKLKDAQLKTANSLINAYAAENESLKMANLEAADALEKSNTVVAEDAAKDSEEE